MPIRSKEAGEILGISPVTVRLWCRQGKLEYTLSATGQRTFNREYLEHRRRELLGLPPEQGQKIFYARSSNGNDVAIATQIEKLTQAYGEPDHIYTDKASGLNEHRRGLNAMLKHIEQHPHSTIHITNNDRLTRFGYAYIENHVNTLKSTITVLDSKDTKEPHHILMEDFMSLIASFSGKFYRLRGWEQRRKLLNDALQELPQQEQPATDIS